MNDPHPAVAASPPAASNRILVVLFVGVLSGAIAALVAVMAVASLALVNRRPA